MKSKYYILLEAETGKVFIRPYSDWEGIRDAINCNFIEFVSPSLLPTPFKFACDDSGLIDGKPINFMASFYYGVMQHNQVIAGDVAILKEVVLPTGEHDLDGLDEIELRFMIFNLHQHFGTVIDHVPA